MFPGGSGNQPPMSGFIIEPRSNPLRAASGQTHVIGVASEIPILPGKERNAYQVLLGGDNGLRGYEIFSLFRPKIRPGQPRIPAFIFPLQLFTVRLGGAAFFRYRNVWDQYEKMEIRDLKSDIGIGLRFGLNQIVVGAGLCDWIFRAALSEK